MFGWAIAVSAFADDLKLQENDMDQKNAEPAQADEAMKDYARPQLVIYGTVKKLVQTGSQSGTENTGHPERSSRP